MKSYKKTIFGTGIIFIVLLMSLLYPVFGPEDYNKQTIIYDNDGSVIGKAPFPPSLSHPVGTDENGQDIMLMMIDGMKVTVLCAILVTVLRVIFGGLTGIIFSFWLSKAVPYFKDLFIGFRYVPTLIIAITFMSPIASATSQLPMMYTMMFQIFVLFLVAFPTVTLSSLEIVNDLRKRTFIESSNLMGANSLFLIRRHLLPYFKSYGLLMMVQQFLATLVLIMHLGLFEFFLGGAVAEGIFGYETPPRAASLSNEWSGLIGQNFEVFVHFPWIVLCVMLGFFFLIGIVNMIKKELEEKMKQDYIMVKKKKESVVEKIENPKKHTLNSTSFVLIKYPHKDSVQHTIHTGRNGKKVAVAFISAGIAASLFIIPFMVGEKKGVNFAADKKDRAVTASTKASTPVKFTPTQPNLEEEKKKMELAKNFNFSKVNNKTEDEVKEVLGEPEKSRKLFLTFEGNLKVPAVSYSYGNSRVEIIFIEGSAKIITLFPASYCDYFKGLSQCLAGMGIKADKFEFKGQTEMQSKIKHAYNVSGMEFIEVERYTMGTNPEIARIMAVTEKKYNPIINIDVDYSQ
ncbi:ABC transporter permease [Neobacillus drentensis]|uniref:ABC transporter permease n=1 Tax=Neobacillus drentensis TaxID=220684 RepID=UPI003000F1FA